MRAGKSLKIHNRHKMEELLEFILGCLMRRQPFIIIGGVDRILCASAVSSEMAQVPPQRSLFLDRNHVLICQALI